MKSLLSVNELSVDFHTEVGKIRAIDNISFQVNKGETVCIVGESGSGKSVTSLSILRLLEYENGIISGGEIVFNDIDLVTLPQEEMRKIRGNNISIIFQEPMTALNPVLPIGRQLMEGIEVHENISRTESLHRARKLLKQVGINDIETRMNQYPHELSGGMRQRVMIAIALACQPKLLIADEPTTALDVTIEAQILNLLSDLKEENEMSMILITHDMGVAAQVADKIVVMYAGKIVEQGSVFDIFDYPTHPYTKALLQSIPRDTGPREDRLYSIKGSIPSLTNLPTGCRFHPRCEFATGKCLQAEPPLTVVNNQQVACWNYNKVVKSEYLKI